MGPTAVPERAHPRGGAGAPAGAGERVGRAGEGARAPEHGETPAALRTSRVSSSAYGLLEMMPSPAGVGER